MDYLIFNVIIPLIIAGILITVVFTLVRIILDIFHINFVITRLIGFFVLYYFIGPYVLNILKGYISGGFNDLVVFVYTPVQVILNALHINI